jgi:iron complex outermembrane recepter protein
MFKRHSLVRFTILVAILIPTTIFSLETNIRGKIIDSNNNPLPKVNIYTTNSGTESIEDGTYILNVDENSVVTFSHIGFNTLSFISNKIPYPVVLHSKLITGKEVIVKAGFKSQSLDKTPASITLINKNELRRKSENHFQALIDNIPNLNYSSGTSRPRYFQIRGIGERSQYVGEGAPNFSVGFMVDGIDFSGIGMAGMLFDTEQIEVFKGPQSSIYGPNAMAGLINITTANPTPFFTGNSIISIGTDNLQTYGLALGGPIKNNLTYRFAFQKHSQDGFRNNIYRNLTNSNKKNEFFLRTKFNWSVSKNINVQFLYFNANLKNGYDAWAVDNNENFNTYTDEQGMDSQKSMSNSIKINYNSNGVIALYQLTKSEHEMEHSYDGDWANNDYWLESPYNFDPYKFYDKTIRNRDNFSHTFRVSFNFNPILEITTGIHLDNISENDIAEGWLFGGDATSVVSNFDIYNRSIYSQANLLISERFSISLNLRNEHNTTKYSSTGENGDWDVYGIVPIPKISENINHSFSGGKLSFIYSLDKSSTIFTSFSKGYKAGGINQNPYLSETGRFYEPEFNQNFEFGFKYNTENITANITQFYMKRTNQQVQISSQQEYGNPNSFYYFTSNATDGTNIGFEFDSKIKITNRLSINSSIGVLNTHVDQYEFWEDTSTVVILGNREQAMAPTYNYSLRINYSHPNGQFVNLEKVAKDEYYFSDSHDKKSKLYSLVNFSTGYTMKNWTLSFWSKNILDTRYATRGFYFGNEPIWNENDGVHEYPDKLYLSYGDPKEIGIKLNYQF